MSERCHEKAVDFINLRRALTCMLPVETCPDCVSPPMILHLQPEDLKDLGLSLGHRKTLKIRIEELLMRKEKEDERDVRKPAFSGKVVEREHVDVSILHECVSALIATILVKRQRLVK